MLDRDPVILQDQSTGMACFRQTGYRINAQRNTLVIREDDVEGTLQCTRLAVAGGLQLELLVRIHVIAEQEVERSGMEGVAGIHVFRACVRPGCKEHQCYRVESGPLH